jgi:hypothetical protein
MKRHINKFLLIAALITAGSCEEKLNVRPQAALDFKGLGTKEGINGLLISAYSALDGWFGWGVAAPWGVGLSNWVYGDVPSDDAGKGGGFGDQPEMNFIEQYKWNPSISYLNDKWIALYEGVARSNDAIEAIKESTQISDADKLLLAGEARFLRAFFHFEAKKIWNKVPFISEEDALNSNFKKTNDEDIWPLIEADLTFCIENLPADQAQVGRVTKGAAQALLGKVHMFQKDYSAAKPLLDAVINNGKYALLPNFEDNFRVATENGKESIFAFQSSVKDGTQDADHGSLNANWGDILAHPSFAPYFSPGFQQPSYNLANAFKTDADGLPLFDTFNDEDINNDKTTAGPFEEYPGNLDPRLDFTVGRKGIPYLGHGDHPGINGIPSPDDFGPYTNRKNNFNKKEMEAGQQGAGWTQGPNAINYNIIRLADVILLRAEVAVFENDLNTARELVNKVRNRAKTGKVVTEDDGVTPAANYVVNEYPAGHAAFSSQDKARQAVYFERRLELALEGHRFFDLVRWDIADAVLSKYVDEESTRRPKLAGQKFVAGKNEYYPIPLPQINASMIEKTITLAQNPGY